MFIECHKNSDLAQIAFCCLVLDLGSQAHQNIEVAEIRESGQDEKLSHLVCVNPAIIEICFFIHFYFIYSNV